MPGPEYRVKHVDGTWRWHAASGTPVFSSEGSFVSFIGISRDITDRKQSEDTLRESEERLKLTLEAVNDGVWDWNISTGKAVFSPSYYTMLGYEPYEFNQDYNTWRSLVHPEDIDRAETEINECIAKNVGYSIEIRMRTKTDDWLWILSRGKTVEVDGRGNPVRMVGTHSVITERKRVEEALREGEQRLHSIIDGSPIPAFVIGKDHRVIHWNKALEEMSSIKHEEVLGTNEHWKAFYTEKRPCMADLLVDESVELVPQWYSGNYIKSPLIESAYEATDFFPALGENGKWLRFTAGAIRDSKGIVVAAIETLEDITDRKVLEFQLRQAQKMEAIGTLAGGIAHDFNNILSAVLGYTEMALGAVDKTSPLRRYLDQVYKAGERARDLVKQILTFSRQSDQNPRPLRVSPIIKEVLKLLRASLPTTIKIRQDIQSDLDTVLADPTHIHQILMNLCNNAAHAMRETKGELKVSLVPVEIKGSDALIIQHGVTPGMYLNLTVSDTGHGIDPVIVERIFDPFFTTKKPGEGTGLGLSVVYGIIKSYGGTINVQSEVGKGTEFRVHLPLLVDTEEEREEKVAAHIVGGEECILFVDDEEDLVNLGKDMLTGLGYQVVGRTSSLEALELLRSRPDRFDLVITDMTMPNMTGSELAQEIMRIRPGIPVILCTGFSEAITPEKAKALGLREFIMKPIIKNQIAAAISRVLNHKE